MKELRDRRDKIDKIDQIIIKNIAQRISIAKKIGLLKNKLNKKIFDPKREQALMKMYNTLSEKHKLDPGFIQQLFKHIIAYSRSAQK